MYVCGICVFAKRKTDATTNCPTMVTHQFTLILFMLKMYFIF